MEHEFLDVSIRTVICDNYVLRFYSNKRRPRIRTANETHIIKMSTALKKNVALIRDNVEEAGSSMQVLDLDLI